VANSAYSSLVWGRPINPDDIGGLTDLRIISLNLVSLIKEVILPLNGYVSRYTETISPLQTTTDPVTGLPVTQYKLNYNDLVYYNPDASNPALTGLITRPILSQSGNLAYIDYPNGSIYYSGVQGNNISTTYDYYSVYVQAGWPDWGFDLKSLEDIRTPLISVDYAQKQNKSFAIGGTYRDFRTFVINITAGSDALRDDLVEILEDSLRIPIFKTINYKLGFPIDFNGDLNPSFNRNNLWGTLKQLTRIKSKVYRDPRLPDKLRHQANLNMTIYIV
jgi:hypothetical protein